MKWKDVAVEKLRSMEMMQRALRNLPREIQRLEAEYEAVGSQIFSGKATSPDHRSREERLLNNIVCRQELRWSLEQTKQWMDSVMSALEVLTPEEMGVLHQLYISPVAGAMERLCEKLQLEKSSIYRKRDSALRKFTLALYGATESN